MSPGFRQMSATKAISFQWNLEEESSETGDALKALVALSAIFTLLFLFEVRSTGQSMYLSQINRSLVSDRLKANRFHSTRILAK